MNDLISRQAAIDAVYDWSNYAMTDEEARNIRQVIQDIKALPSVQSEIIRCKDCKWKQGSECVRFADVRPFADDYCSRAERRTNGCLNQQKSGD